MLYKRYKFSVNNWKSGKSFWFYKDFPSACCADRWAMKISFSYKNSPYMISACFGEEIPCGYYQPYPTKKFFRREET